MVNDDEEEDKENMYKEIHLCSILLCILCVHGYIFRHILASLDFNENLQRDTKLTKDGEKYFKVTYPEYKLGEEVVPKVASPPTYSEFKYSTVCKYHCLAVMV